YLMATTGGPETWSADFDKHITKREGGIAPQASPAYVSHSRSSVGISDLINLIRVLYQPKSDTVNQSVLGANVHEKAMQRCRQLYERAPQAEKAAIVGCLSDLLKYSERYERVEYIKKERTL